MTTVKQAIFLIRVIVKAPALARRWEVARELIDLIARDEQPQREAIAVELLKYAEQQRVPYDASEGTRSADDEVALRNERDAHVIDNDNTPASEVSTE